MAARPLLVLGTANRSKGLELVEVFAPVGVDLVTLADFPEALHVVESAQTFAANAALKATQQARHLGRWVLGEDSGLMVDALGGAPGVYSARYSGAEATGETNNRLLLEKLAAVPPEQRTARYVCHMVLADPAGSVQGESEGTCCGRIIFEPRGTNGFGYDPLFEVLEYHRTFGQLSSLVKSCLSHRARAAQAMIPRLIELADIGQLGAR